MEQELRRKFVCVCVCPVSRMWVRVTQEVELNLGYVFQNGGAVYRKAVV